MKALRFVASVFAPAFQSLLVDALHWPAHSDDRDHSSRQIATIATSVTVPSGAFSDLSDGELAGDQNGAAAIAILDDLHEIASLAGGEAIGSPIVEHKEIDPDQHPEQPREAAVTMREIEIGEQARHARVVDGATVAASLLRERAG